MRSVPCGSVYRGIAEALDSHFGPLAGMRTSGTNPEQLLSGDCHPVIGSTAQEGVAAEFKPAHGPHMLPQATTALSASEGTSGSDVVAIDGQPAYGTPDPGVLEARLDDLFGDPAGQPLQRH